MVENDYYKNVSSYADNYESKDWKKSAKWRKADFFALAGLKSVGWVDFPRPGESEVQHFFVKYTSKWGDIWVKSPNFYKPWLFPQMTLGFR